MPDPHPHEPQKGEATQRLPNQDVDVFVPLDPKAPIPIEDSDDDGDEGLEAALALEGAGEEPEVCGSTLPPVGSSEGQHGTPPPSPGEVTEWFLQEG